MPKRNLQDETKRNFISSNSDSCVSSQLDLLQTPETQAAALSGKWITISPFNSLAGGDAIVFEYPGDTYKYLDLSKTFIIIEAKVVTSTGADLGADDECGPVNNFMHSLFSQVDIKLNEVLITPSQNMYPYRAMFETLLNFSEDTKKSKMSGALYYKDTAGQMDTIGEANGGYKKRKVFIARSRKVQMVGQLHADIFFQDRYLINGVKMQMILSRTQPAFSMMYTVPAANAKAFKIDITRATLYLRQVTINPDVLLAHAKVLSNPEQTVKYPIKRVEMKSLSVPIGTTVFGQAINHGNLPARVVIGMVSSNAFAGSYMLNPYNFQHFGLTSIGLTVDGEAVPSQKLDLDFVGGNTVEGYNTLFTGIDKLYDGNDIDRNDYNRGYTLFAYDLSPDLCSGNHFDLVGTGTLKLDMSFSPGLTEGINVIVYMEYQKMIEINQQRAIIMKMGND